MGMEFLLKFILVGVGVYIWGAILIPVIFFIILLIYNFFMELDT